MESVLVFEREGSRGVWSVEAIGPDGEVYQALFVGREARERAEEHAAFKYGARR
jgi:hypothetical protein